MIIDTLIEKIKKTENPTVVGLDPRYSFIPSFIKRRCVEEYGKTPKAVAQSFWEFNKALIDAVYDLVPAVKPQIALYVILPRVPIVAFIYTSHFPSE